MKYLIPDRQPHRKDLPYQGCDRVVRVDISYPLRIDHIDNPDQFITGKVYELETMNTEIAAENIAFLIIYYYKTTKIIAREFHLSFSNITWTDRRVPLLRQLPQYTHIQRPRKYSNLPAVS